MPRNIEKILHEIAQITGYSYESHEQGWQITLTNNYKKLKVSGYRFPLNTKDLEKLCDNKSNCSELLKSLNIPCIPHKIFLHNPRKSHIINTAIICESILDHIKNHPDFSIDSNGFPIVLKRNDGTGGINIFKINNEQELRSICAKYFINISTCISPYYEIEDEFRTIILNYKTPLPKALLTFKKSLPRLIGNGVNTWGQLLEQYINNVKNQRRDFTLPLNDEESSRLVTNILSCLSLKSAPGEIKYLSWKHNLANGATVDDSLQNPLFESVEILAKQTAQSINAGFVSIDIVKIKNSPELKIMEINSGVMMENFIGNNNERMIKASAIYSEAVGAYFSNHSS